MDKSKVEIKLTPGEVFEIKPEGKYLIIFQRADVNKGDLSYIDRDYGN